MDIELDFDPISLTQIADALDALPGPEDTGLRATDRSRLFTYLDAPDRAGWYAIHNVHITRRHTVRVAVMRHCQIGMYVEPSPRQLLATLQAAAAGTIRP